MDQLKGKVAAVTGATGSIGRGIATRFAREGAQVALIDSDATRGRELVSQIEASGGKAKFFQADVTAEQDAKRAINEAIQACGRLDVLANSNWAQAPWKPLAEKDVADFASAINRNLFGALYSMRAVYSQMKQQGGGRIINVGSPYGATTFNNVTDAITADWALQGLTRATAAEWAISNILVNFLSPALVDIPEFQAFRATDPVYIDRVLAQTALKRLGDPVEDIGGAAMFLASDEACFITGHPVYADGGQFISSAVFAPGVKFL
jgi:NAD(P)-dependent dehydrogenase (short-subunit alcohol dehydrogenase family)